MDGGPFLPAPPLKLQESSPFSFFLSEGVVVAGLAVVAVEDGAPRLKPEEDSAGLAVVAAEDGGPRVKPDEDSAGLVVVAAVDGGPRVKPDEDSAGLF